MCLDQEVEKKKRKRKEKKREGITHKDKKNTILKLGSFKEEEIGLLKRGETKLLVDEVLTINNNIKHTKDTYRIIAHGIYGSGRYSKLISRNVWKYIQIHEVEEKEKFTPFLGKLNNNTYRWIHTWSMFCAFIRNRDLLVTTYELDIISRLYDVTVKIFRNTEAGFRCTWVANLHTHREVNILTTVDNEWLHLVKVNKQFQEKIG